MTDLPTAEAPLDALFMRIELARQTLLMLDYDGTLAPFRVDPAQAVPYPGVAEALDGILQLPGTRIVLVSGRRADTLVSLVGTRQPLEIWGSHGWERLLPDGEHRTTEVTPAALRALEQAALLAEPARELGARLESKGCALAVHWRGLVEALAQRIRDLIRGAWEPLCAQAPVKILEFDGGIELLASGRSKADAVLGLLQESPPHTPSAYLGDDVTDEDAFAAIRGKGLGVLVRPQQRESLAQAWLQPPHELLVFLHRWQRARGGAL